MTISRGGKTRWLLALLVSIALHSTLITIKSNQQLFFSSERQHQGESPYRWDSNENVSSTAAIKSGWSLADFVRLAVPNKTAVICWHYNESFQLFLDFFPTLKDFEALYPAEYNRSDASETARRQTGAKEFWGSLNADVIRIDDACAASKLFQRYHKTKPHILIGGLNENWGLFSYYEPNRTADWGPMGVGWDCTLDNIMEYLDHPNLLAVFTIQHQELSHPKVWSIPLGISREDVLPFVDNLEFVWKFIQKPSVEKTRLLTMNFRALPEYRKDISDQIIRNFGESIVNHSYVLAMDRDMYYESLRVSKFVLCPSGIGYDTYRMWEVLYMGSIPIVERTRRGGGWEKTADKLPVLWVDDFALVTPDLLAKEYLRMTKRTDYQFERLTMDWWVSFVHSYLDGTST